MLSHSAADVPYHHQPHTFKYTITVTFSVGSGWRKEQENVEQKKKMLMRKRKITLGICNTYFMKCKVFLSTLFVTLSVFLPPLRGSLERRRKNATNLSWAAALFCSHGILLYIGWISQKNQMEWGCYRMSDDFPQICLFPLDLFSLSFVCLFVKLPHFVITSV